MFSKIKKRIFALTRNCNSGDWNSGDWNSGNDNSGHFNSGHHNSGNWNSGNSNSGDWNSGDKNSGDRNSGHSNSGHSNSGHCNSGNDNSGHCNSSTGYQNSFCNQTKYFLFNQEVSKETYGRLKEVRIDWFDSRNGTYQEAWAKCPPKILDKFREIPEFQTKEAKEIFKEITGLEL